MKKNNIGILTPISWNSNLWQDEATDKDIAKSNFEYVKENGWMNEDLNFGYEKYESEDDDYYIGYTPMFNNLPAIEQSKYVDIIFFRSLDYQNKVNCIVGFYSYPELGSFHRLANETLFDRYEWGNVKAKTENIVLLKNFIPINDDIVKKFNFIPNRKKIGKMGFNYLFYENVISILDKATELNPDDKKLSSIKFKFLTEKKYKFQ